MKPIPRLLALSLIATACAAAAPPKAQRILPPRMGAAELAGYLPESSRVEARIDADVTGDGIKDVIAIGAAEDQRKLVVLAGYSGETDVGYRPIGSTQLDPSPLGAARLKVDRGVLIVEDLTGGTSATSSLYRWRYDAKADQMRLIGDDVTYYSRTNQHDSIEISTNRLTGQRTVVRNKLAEGKAGDAAYVPGKKQPGKVPLKPIYMGTEPSPEETLEKAQ